MNISQDISSNMCPGCGGCCIGSYPELGTSKEDSEEAFERFAKETDESFEVLVSVALPYCRIYGNMTSKDIEQLKDIDRLLENHVPRFIYSLSPKPENRYCFFLTDDLKCSAYNLSRPNICQTYFCTAVENAQRELDSSLIPLEQILKTYTSQLVNAANRSKQN
ncbi:MAG: YkgJ family cysteine cluster protein [DPANN group archaeon]|nr:YkgJ family cysteine cluster protein [DPANN group archaeon]